MHSQPTIHLWLKGWTAWDTNDFKCLLTLFKLTMTVLVYHIQHCRLTPVTKQMTHEVHDHKYINGYGGAVVYNEGGSSVS